MHISKSNQGANMQRMCIWEAFEICYRRLVHIFGHYFSVRISNIFKLLQSIIFFCDKAIPPGDNYMSLETNRQL